MGAVGERRTTNGDGKRLTEGLRAMAQLALIRLNDQEPKRPADPRPAGGTGGGGERVGQEMIADGVMREATIGDLINGGEERAGFPTQKAREALAENGARTGVSVPRNDGREALGNGGTCVFELIRPGMHIRITNDDVLLQRGRLMQARGMIALAINAMGPLPRDDEIERLIELHDDQGPADQFGSFGGTE